MVTQHDSYAAAAPRCRAAFAADSDFRRECLAATDEVLENRRREGHQLSDPDRLRAVNDVMAELPLILFGPELFNVKTSTFVDHRPLRLFDSLFAGAFSIAPASGQHFVIAHELTERKEMPSRDTAAPALAAARTLCLPSGSPVPAFMAVVSAVHPSIRRLDGITTASVEPVGWVYGL